MSHQEFLFHENMRILTHSKSFSETFSDAEYLENQTKLREKGLI